MKTLTTLAVPSASIEQRAAIDADGGSQLREALSQRFLIPVIKTLNGRKYAAAKRHQRLLEKEEFLDRDLLARRQQEKLRGLVRYCYAHVPYYRRLFSWIGLHPEDIQTESDFQKIPVLTKELIVANYEELLSETCSGQKLIRHSTGGTSGSPLNFVRELAAEHLIDGSNWRFFNYCGYQLGAPLAMLWGNESELLKSETRRGRLKAIMDNKTILNCFELTEERMARFASAINTLKPRYWKGYAGVVHRFCRFLKANEIQIPKPDAVIITAEKIDQAEKAELNDFFEGRVFEEYGCKEFSILAFECDRHQGLHVDMHNAYIEIIDTRESDGYGNVVVTSFVNSGMPFLRYQTQDRACLDDGTCPCGRTSRKFRDIQGRVTDFVRTKSRKEIHGHFFNALFFDTEGIEQYQIRQTEEGKITVWVAVNGRYRDETRRQFLGKLEEAFGSDLAAEYRIVDTITLPPSGKFRRVVRELPGKEAT